jgi:hypothetical protein
MAYTILNTDGTTLLLLADNTVDKSATTLDLFGKNVNSYGEYLHNNLIKLLANSASSSGSPPRNPLKGQIWYDTTIKRLKIYDNGFKNISGAIISSETPRGLTNGDMWYDTRNEQLFVVAQNSIKLVGPGFPKTSADSGWRLPSTEIRNTSSNTQQVLMLKSYGQFLGMATKNSFQLTSSDASLYFASTSNNTVVSGITLGGDLRVYGNIETTGQMTNRFLSASFDIDKISYNTATVTTYSHYLYQNEVIKTYLSRMFPVNANTATNEIGLPLGSECRTVCVYSLPSSGTQARRFRVVNDAVQGKSWQPYSIYTAGWTSEFVNVMA